jgi:predicted TPR repeat methyltransferase
MANERVHESEEFWERFTASASLHPANLYRYTLISDLIKKWPEAKDYIVDLGCGNAALIKHIKELKLGKTLVGFDGSAAITEINKKKLPFAEFSQADLQVEKTFPLHNVADIVVCSEVVEHMPEYLPTFKIAHKCLKDNCLFILTTQGGKRRKHDVHLLGHLRHYVIEDLAREVQEAGFEIIHTQQAGWPALTAQKIIASLFMGQVEEQLASTKEPSRLFKIACKIIGVGLACSSKSFGPQLVIAARKKV